MILEREKNKEAELLPNYIDQTPNAVPPGFPCGILRCTYEKQPKAIYANDWMFQFLGTDRNSEDWQEFIQQNIFFMIPFEERDLFKRDLQRARESTKAVPIKHWIRNCSGGKTCFMGWIQMIYTDAGEKEYTFFYIPISETCLVLQNEREVAYEKALGLVFDGIFCIEWTTRIMECICAKPNIQMPNTPGIQMMYDDKVWREFLNQVYDEDRARVEAFFTQRCEEARTGKSKESNHRIDFRTIQEDTVKEMMVIAVDLKENSTLFCCREMTHENYIKHIAEEIESIRTISMDVTKRERMHPSKSMVYRLSGEYVYLQFGNDENFGFGGMVLREFLQHCEISDEEFRTALQDGKVFLDGMDCSFEIRRILYAVRRAGLSEECEEYLLFLYTFEMDGAMFVAKRPRVRIHTFGYFDIFVDGKPIVFRYEKSKEMLAILIDRKGSFVSNPYFISCLWGDEPYSEKVRSRCRQVVYRMMETLKQYGVEDIIEKVDGHRRIIPEKIECDYFDYVSGKKGATQLFHGAYMSDYSWGEETLAILLKREGDVTGA